MEYPPFCPNRNCKMHWLTKRSRSWYTLSGYYFTHTFGRIRRYECRACRKRFSQQSFSLDYAAKRKLPYDYILKQLKSAAGIRDIARDLKVSPTTITNRITRLSRQALSIHSYLKSSIRLKEDLVADGFESFAVSQYFPDNIHLLAGKESQYLYAFDYAHMNRKGRMTDYQKERNRILKNSTPGAVSITRSFSNLCKQIDLLLENGEKSGITLYTDEKPQYRKVLSDLTFNKKVTHRRVNSKKVRNLSNDLFSVNYLDREIRKDNANHVRETVQFSRNVNNNQERLAVYSLYHNYMKPYRIKRPEGMVHAEVAGVRKELISAELKTLYTQRRFYSRMKGLTFEEFKIWLRGFATPGKTGYEYVPQFAWA